MRNALRLSILALGIVLSGCVYPYQGGYAPSYYYSGEIPKPAVVVIPVEEKKPRHYYGGGPSSRGFSERSPRSFTPERRDGDRDHHDRRRSR